MGILVLDIVAGLQPAASLHNIPNLASVRLRSALP